MLTYRGALFYWVSHRYPSCRFVHMPLILCVVHVTSPRILGKADAPIKGQNYSR